MAQKCWLLLFENCAGVKGHSYLSKESVSTSPGSCGVVLVYDGQYTGIGERSAIIYDVSSGAVTIPPEYATNYANECQPSELIKYDCVNGACIVKTQYNTPGLYNSLSDCQALCANGGACAAGKVCIDPTTFCPDGKVCIEQGEFSSIEALISKIGSEVC